jgi:hypothetical protein
MLLFGFVPPPPPPSSLPAASDVVVLFDDACEALAAYADLVDESAPAGSAGVDWGRLEAAVLDAAGCRRPGDGDEGFVYDLGEYTALFAGRRGADSRLKQLVALAQAALGPAAGRRPPSAGDLVRRRCAQLTSELEESAAGGGAALAGCDVGLAAGVAGFRAGRAALLAQAARGAPP